MYDKLIKYNRLNETILLIFLSILCFSMSTFRVLYTSEFHYLFLNWNLFLAFMPWLFSSLIIVNPELKKKKPVLVLLLFSWLIFFPNAPYIFTDLIHLRDWYSMPDWYDVILILSFSWTGLLFGFLSLWDIENIFKNRLNPKLIPFISTALLFVAGYGVYLGRYGRWNSWDIVRNPFGLMENISDELGNPASHRRAWGMALLIGLFLNIIYWSIRLIKKKEQ